jgi:DNA-binding NarL/FixJ family response regulator
MVMVEQHALVRAVLRQMIDDQPDIEIIAEVDDVGSAIEIVQNDPPDVILVDAEPPISLMVPSLQRLKRECPNTRVVLLGHRRDDEELFRAIQSGAAAHVVDDARPSELLRTIRAVAQGEYLIDDSVTARPSVARRVLEAFRDASLLGENGEGGASDHAFAPLSKREAEILECIGQGRSNRDVAGLLGISEKTVKNHVTSILRKLAVNDRTQAVLHALRKSWISFPDDDAPRDEGPRLN